MEKDPITTRRAKKVAEAGLSVPIAHFSETIVTNDKLDELISAVQSIPQTVIPEMPEMPEADFTETNRLLQELIDKENKPEDINITLSLI